MLSVADEMSEDDLVKTGNTALRGHADAGALTFITSQPMASLQFRDYHDGKWKYVGYRPNALVVNIGDRFEVRTRLSPLLCHSTLISRFELYFAVPHRRFLQEHYPPRRCASCGPERSPSSRPQYVFHLALLFDWTKLDSTRLTSLLFAVYFCDHNPTILIDPRTLSSPKLDRLGFVKPDEWERITGEQWDDIKGKSFGKGDVNSTTGEEPAPLLIYGRLAERWHQLGK